MKLGKAEGRVVSIALESTNPESQTPFVSGFGFLGCNGMGDGPRASILDRRLGRSVGEWGGEAKEDSWWKDGVPFGLQESCKT